MNQVAASFIISQIIDGDTVMGGLMSTKALAQFYNEGDAQVVPNWNTPANQPVIYPYIYLGSDATPLIPTGVTWYYMDKNTKAVITDASPFDLTEFEIQTGITVPALKLIGNLANNTSNMEKDVIFFKGTVYPQGAGGAPMEVNLQIDINISQATGSGLYANIICKNNNVEVPPVLSESISSLVLTAKAYSASDAEQSGLSRKWYKNGTDTLQTGESITVMRDSNNAWQQVDAYAIYRCDFLDNGSVVASAFIEVQDATDPYMIKIDWTDNRTQLAKGETATGQCAVVKRSSPSSTVSGFSYAAVLTKANGTAIDTSQGTATVSSSGAISINYAALNGNGGSIAGYITATKS